MSKFRVGDRVQRVSGYFIGMQAGDTDVVVGFGPNGGLKLTRFRGVTHDEANFVLYEPEPVQPQTQEWSYSEASRLQVAAHAAIDEYNNYIDSNPDTVFLKIFK